MNKIIGIVTVTILVFLFEINNTYATVTNQLELGSKGIDVTRLQTYLASDAGVYPSGLVTGFFGPLTQEGVRRFQATERIVSDGTPETTGYGRVGPQTITRLNTLINSDNGQILWGATPGFVCQGMGF